MNFWTRRILHLCAGFALVFAASAENATTDIKVDQVGYLSGSDKLVMVVVSPHEPSSASLFQVKRTNDHSVVFSGELKGSAYDADSGDTVRTADFTKFDADGAYYVEVPGTGRSWNFRIGPDVYRRPYYLTFRSFYGQRCGSAVDMGPEFPQYSHAICHTDGAYDASSGKSGPHVSSKGWHDAGDYGRYVVNSGITTGTLLWTWELFHDRLDHISLNIPESGRRIPDILSEVRWNLDWMMSMQDADGGVFHKQTRAHFSAFIMPEQDKLTSLVFGTGKQPFKSSCATADLAAVAAVASRLFKPYDSSYANKTLAAASAAWKWLEAHPNVTFQNPPGISTGDYGDRDCSDERLWASAELARSTSAPEYGRYLLDDYGEFLKESDAQAAGVIRKGAIEAADGLVNRGGQHPYRISLTTRDYIWGTNAVAANYSMQLLIANIFKPDRRYTAAALDNLHYLLGRNTFSLSWITQVGEHSVEHPHHRPSAADHIDQPWPGLLAGGPNPGRQDRAMKPHVNAARAYIDMAEAYACNEVAINWNAPLVFTLAAFVSSK